MSLRPLVPPLGATLRSGERTWRVEIVGARPFSLCVAFQEAAPPDRCELTASTLHLAQGALELGPSWYEPHAAHPQRRKGDPTEHPGHGTLWPSAQLFDFSALVDAGTVRDVGREFQQLPLLFGRRRDIDPSFRELVARLAFDFRVYRSVFDQIDRALEHEIAKVRERVHRQVLASQYQPFAAFYRRANAELSGLVAEYPREKHEQHGYYFRKQMHDIIHASQFLTRTNERPRGYAGDSEMMELLYANAFCGATLFAKCMHKFPLELPAAQAVRNRRALLTAAVLERRAIQSSLGDPGPLSVCSLACGSAREIIDIVQANPDASAFQFTLLDQDPAALADAKATLQEAERLTGAPLTAHFVQESVRTMLRAPDLAARLGHHHLVYAMGLFDYLTPPVARAVLARCYSLLRPGGDLIIGNYHVCNPDRVYMEYWADWVLYYRDEQQLLDLATALPGASSRVEFEAAGCQMFLRVRRDV